MFFNHYFWIQLKLKVILKLKNMKMEIGCIGDFLLQVPKIHDQEIPEKEQP